MLLKIPTFQGHLPFIGAAHLFSTDMERTLNLLIEACKMGTPCLAWMAYSPVVFLHKPEDIEIILNSPSALSKYDFYRFFKPVAGNGLMTAPVSIWKLHRKTMMPTFNQKILNQYFDVFMKQADIFVEVLESDTGRVFDITERINNWSLDTICETVMGVNINSQHARSLLVQSIYRIFETTFTRIVNVLYHSDLIYALTKTGRDEKAAIQVLHNFVDKILKQKRHNLEKKRKEELERPEAEISEDSKMVPFLDLFVELSGDEGKFTDAEVKDETNTILVTGSETSATAIGYVVLVLGMFPEVQQKVYEEIVDVVGYERQVTLSDFTHFKYLERVIKETLRIFPVGPFFFRNIDEDIDITNNYTLPKGCAAGIAAMVLHRSPEYWPDPLKFDPDRFLPEEIAKRHPYSYIPFSAGPRNCIGMKYAMISIKTLLVCFIRKYHVETHYKSISEIRTKLNIVLKPVEGFPVKLMKRNN